MRHASRPVLSTRFAPFLRGCLALGLVLSGLGLGNAHAATGFMRLLVPVGNDVPLEVGIWYPADATAAPHAPGPFEQELAPGAAVAGTRLPLVLISHGTGGSLGSHRDTAQALAQAGFVVAAPTHTGDNYQDLSRVARIAERPLQVRAMLDYLLTQWPDHARIDARRIGIFGFSAGGFTALAAIGGQADLGKVGPHCQAHPDEWSCRYLRNHADTALPPTARPAADTGWDPRLKAAVIAAPALGYAFAPDGLARVRVPLQLWRADDDRILPEPDFADAVRQALPAAPEYHEVAGAGHYDFLAPCTAAQAALVPEICVEGAGFSRARFHRQFNAEVVAFFQRTLAAPNATGK
ncbi:dienelactone hydrolase [Cupriavidus basilensis]|uniref:Dienelactone hydrolase n=1 Tax=Cupriavidus basilensis TaxID=68895 RepID=A0ABT6AXT0_9BURK|nr:dienelactone hydrolase [Cupriavidus basilensis]MDF3837294.1 dienelactone hydrolase [Cupriavidus basilensis]